MGLLDYFIRKDTKKDQDLKVINLRDKKQLQKLKKKAKRKKIGAFKNQVWPFRRFSVTQAFEGAKDNRKTRHWEVSDADPNDELIFDRINLVLRSRDLYKNTDLGKGAIKRHVTNVIGTGLLLQATPDFEFLGMSPEEGKELTRTIERLWRADIDRMDIAGFSDYYRMQRLAFLSFLKSGEVFGIIRTTDDGLKLQLIESDHISSPINQTTINKNLFDGVKVGKFGQPTGYWVYNQRLDKHQLVKVKGKSGQLNIMHFFQQERPGQLRGIPWLSNVILKIRDYQDLNDSELTAANIQSMLTLWIQSDNPADVDNPLDGDTDETDVPEDEADSEENDYIMQPGAINHLMPGQKIDMANPMRPHSNFNDFAVHNKQDVAMGIGMPYEILMMLFSTSFTASKGAKEEYKKIVMEEREIFNSKWNKPFYKEWFIDKVLRGQIKAPGFFDSIQNQEAYTRCVWVGMAQGLIDPVKETLAAQMRIQSGLSTHSQETSNLTGGDFETNAKKLKQEREEIGHVAAPSGALITEQLEESEREERNNQDD